VSCTWVGAIVDIDERGDYVSKGTLNQISSIVSILLVLRTKITGVKKEDRHEIIIICVNFSMNPKLL
jgi:hypothetical protein